MGARMRAMDWSATPLGPPEEWSQSLKTAVRIMLTSRQAMFVWWGEELINLYNDAYKAIVGGKHPEALGQPASSVWREIWDQVGPRAASAMRDNEGTYDESLLLIMERNGYPEETYYTFSYSPVPSDQGGPGGIICANTDDTQRIVGERQLALLRELAVRTADARTFDAACTLSARGLETNPFDIPFAMIYLIDPDRRRVFLAGTCGIGRDHPAVPEAVALHGDSVWPFADVVATHRLRLVPDLDGVPGPLPSGAWHRPPHQAVAVPIAPSGQTGKAGILVVGLNPFRLFDDSYQRFIELVSAQIAASIGNAQAYDEERRRAETLAELDRAKTAFFSNVSHEFRTPLTLMLGPLEDLLAKPAADLHPEPRETLTVVHRNGRRLLKLVNALLDFSRIEAGRVQAVYEPVDLAAVTAELTSVFRAAVERAGLQLTIECPMLPEPVFVDRDMWEKIVLNLMANAFKFTFEGGIHVALRWSDDHVELDVRDTGIGIADAELPHLFERFHRVLGTRARTHEGTGIGLALVHELVKLHGGAVRVQSRVGEGTTFTVAIPTGSGHLPADRVRAERAPGSTANGVAPYVDEALRWIPADIEPEALVPRAAPGVASAGARVLLADDNADMRDYVRRLLGAYWTVEAVADGSAALAAAKREAPDLVLSDVMMPGLDGFALLRALRADPATATVPVILLSARAGEESRVEGLEAGADDYLVKPFTARELIARVSAHLAMARVRREAVRRERAAREEAEEANRSKDAFLALLSHELRTPLNSILGWATMLRDGSMGAAAAARGLEVIERNARVQTQLIEDLLDVSRIITGKLRLDVRPVDLAAVITAALDVVRPSAAAKGIHLESVLDPRAGPLLGDPDRLQQVMWNLLSNAIKFTPTGGRVSVVLRRGDAHVEAIVSDTGVGIEADLIPVVFERFRQGDSSTTRSHGGLGLGLTLVRHLVEMHGGTVEARSAGSHRGASFVVRLPVMADVPPAAELEEPVMRPATLASGMPLANGLRVLAVDDDADTLDLFRQVLETHRAEVRTAARIADALDVVQRWRPHVVLCDIEMSGEDGYAFVQRLRELPADRGGTTPAIAVTAHVRAEDHVRVLTEGFQLHVTKPVEPADLVAVIATVTGRALNSAAP